MFPDKPNEPENEKQNQEPQAGDSTAKESRSRRFFRRAANIVAGTVVASAVATEIVFLIMFGRTKPIDRSGFPLRHWAAQNGFSWNTVEFLSGENTLRGYIVSPKDPIAFLLIAHGMNGSSKGFEPVVQFFAERGYAVMVFDGTASGSSDGERVVGLQQARFDIRAAIDFINNDAEYSKLSLAVMGHSAGAYGTAAESGSACVDAVVCISGFESPIRTMHHWARTYTSILGDIQYPFMAAHEYDQLGSEANTSASAALLASGTPALVVHGQNDEAIPLSISLYQKLCEAGSKRITLVLDNTEGHTKHGEILVNEDGEPNAELLESIDRFLRSVLPIRGAGSR